MSCTPYARTEFSLVLETETCSTCGEFVAKLSVPIAGRGWYCPGCKVLLEDPDEPARPFEAVAG